MTIETSTLRPAPTFVPVAAVNDVPPGWVLKVNVRHHTIALANCEGTFFALDNACSHASGPLGNNRLQQGCLVECPWHNSMFDVRTGEPQKGPARKAQRTYPVKVEDDTVFVAFDETPQPFAAEEK
jgi:nitrite reductase/ring-hydroxylating ferredoxin subunit